MYLILAIISPVPYVFSLEIFGDYENYIFLESLESCEYEKQGCIKKKP